MSQNRNTRTGLEFLQEVLAALQEAEGQAMAFVENGNKHILHRVEVSLLNAGELLLQLSAGMKAKGVPDPVLQRVRDCAAPVRQALAFVASATRERQASRRSGNVQNALGSIREAKRGIEQILREAENLREA